MRNYINTAIEIDIAEENALAILLHKDGTINRKGDGSSDIDNNMFMGIVNSDIFDKLIQVVDKEFEECLGNGIDMNDKKGKTCVLEITLSDETTTYGTKVIYGSESVSIPPPIDRYIRKAIELTNPWYREQ